MELNFVFCEWEPYINIAPEQKTENANRRRNSMFLRRLIYLFIELRDSTETIPYKVFHDILGVVQTIYRQPFLFCKHINNFTINAHIKFSCKHTG